MKCRAMRRLLACLALLSAVGCAHAPKSGARDPFPCPAAGGRTWRELTSANFVLRTDFDEPAARTALQSYEDTLATFKDIVELFLPAAEPPTRTSIIVFADWRQFHQLLSDKMAGVFIRHDEHRRPLIVLPSYANETMFRHELMHRLIHQRLPDLPDWLNEGLAEYFSTVDLRDGNAFVGGTTARGSLLTDARYYGASHLERVHEMPSLSVLV